MSLSSFMPQWWNLHALLVLCLAPGSCQPGPQAVPPGAAPKGAEAVYYDPTAPSSWGDREKIQILFADQKIYEDADLKQLSTRETYVWDINWLHAEWENGGTDQAIWNDTDDRILLACTAFEAIGAGATAAALREACQLFPEGRPASDYEVRREQMRALAQRHPRPFDQFDTRMFSDDVFGLLLAHWRAHEPPADATPAALRNKRAMQCLFVELPVAIPTDIARLSKRQRCVWDLYCIGARMGPKGKATDLLLWHSDAEFERLGQTLDDIRAVQTAAILRKLRSLYPQGRPSSDSKRHLEQMTALLQPARQMFADLEITDGVVRRAGWEEDLYALILTYWHRQDD